MRKIAVIGSGTMGNGIAHVFARYGYQVSMVDVNEQALNKGLENISINLGRQVFKGTLSETEKQAALNKIQVFTWCPEAVQDVDLVIEAATENEDTKLQIFRELDQYCPASTLFASNTSSLSITKLASVTTRADKIIGMHFMNPVPMMKLVEVVRGYRTSSETVLSIVDLSKKLEKEPVVVNDYPGFVANRILMPMINEAIATLYEGVAGVEEIDVIMKLGMAHPMGPLLLADFIGLDVCLAILKVLHQGFGNPKYAPCPLLTTMVEAGALGKKSGEGFYLYKKDSKEHWVSPRFNINRQS